MEAFLLSFAVIFIAELGGKSQLMATTFATRYKFWTVVGAITVATAIVHLFSVALGNVMGLALPIGPINMSRQYSGGTRLYFLWPMDFAR